MPLMAQSPAAASSPPAAEVPSSAPSTTAPRCHANFLSLPEETQKEIFGHCRFGDLICLAVVCRHFRDLAAEKLYHSISISFPSDADRRLSDSMRELPLCLDTFATSDYDYAQFLRRFALDTPGIGALAATSYKQYHYSLITGKFLNTLLLVALRKARKLESLFWNVRIEISRPLYKVLHNIDTLKNVEIRLPAGPSQHEALAQLPILPASQSLSPSSSASTTTAVTPVENSLLIPLPPQTSAVNHQQQTGGFFNNTTFGPMFFQTAPSTTHHTAPQPILEPRSKPLRLVQLPDDPPTISGFKNLKCLRVLDIENLDIIPEIRKCVRNSAGTLTELCLSFSDNLAHKARKVVPVMDGDSDSELDDPFGPAGLPISVAQMPVAGDTFGSGQNKQLHVHEARKEQESALGKILDVEKAYDRAQPDTNSITPDALALIGDDNDDNLGSQDQSGRIVTLTSQFSTSLNALASSIRNSDVVGDADFDQKRIAILDSLVTLFERYNSKSARSDTIAQSFAGTSGSASLSDHVKPGSQDVLRGEFDNQSEADAEASSADTSTLFTDVGASLRAKGSSSQDASPEDIDVEEPEGQLVLDPQDDTTDSDKDEYLAESEPETQRPSATTTLEQRTLVNQTDPLRSSSKESQQKERPAKSALKGTARPTSSGRQNQGNGSDLISILTAQSMRLDDLHEMLSDELRDLKSRSRNRKTVVASSSEQHLSAIAQDVASTRENLIDLQNALQDLQMPKGSVGADGSAEATKSSSSGDSRRRMAEYVRSTRGLSLEIIAFYQIPVKASVLSKAVDLRVLRRLTLLNVGPQAPIWTLLARENRLQPLPLRTIHTDNVTNAFLKCVSQLEELNHLCLVEGAAKYEPETHGLKATPTIHDIRRWILRKHAPTLRILSIRNLNGSDWDLDEATVKLLSKRAPRLEELAVSMNMQSIHAFLQLLPGFTSLFALHVVRLHNDDTCVWVMKETKRFLIDTLYHYPHLRLEYLAIDSPNIAEHILRVDARKEREKRARERKAKAAKAKGKQKATGGPGLNSATSANPLSSSGHGIGSHLGMPPTTIWSAGYANNNSSSSNNNSNVSSSPPAIIANNHSVGGMDALAEGLEEVDDEIDEDDDTDLSDIELSARRPHLKMVPVFMSDVWDVVIFEKEIISSRL